MDKQKFPSSFEEFYEKITKANKSKKIKIKKSVAKKYYNFIFILGEVPSFDLRKKRISSKEELQEEVFNALILCLGEEYYPGKCPNCGNLLISTSGSSHHSLKSPSRGGFCLNCGKSFLVSYTEFKEFEKPFFIHSNI